MNEEPRTENQAQTGGESPIVTVLMCVYNGEPFLREAIESVLEQTLSAFEFVIVDDASTDRTPSILGDYVAQDDRIRLLRNDANVGLTASLNRGLGEAKAEYVARIDADDVCVRHRLERQMNFLKQHPDVAVVGSWADVVDAQGRSKSRRRPRLRSHGEAVYALLRGSHRLLHPSIMMRRCVIDGLGGYNERVLTAQDYDLWVRLALAGHQGRVLEEPLIKYREHKRQVTAEQRKNQKESKERAFEELLLRFWEKDDLVRIRRFLAKDARLWLELCEEQVSELLDIVENEMPSFREAFRLSHEDWVVFRKLWRRFMMVSAIDANRIGEKANGRVLLTKVMAQSPRACLSLSGLIYALTSLFGGGGARGNLKEKCDE